MQFRFPTNLTAVEYVRMKAWKDFVVCRCLIHPDRDCGFSYHGTYDRVTPKGTKIARFLCHTEKKTFSMLPDCFSSRLTGTLIEIETVVLMVEKAEVRDAGRGKPSTMENVMLSSLDLASAADELDVSQNLYDLALDFRWLKRRVDYVCKILSNVINLFPEKFKNHRPSLTSFRSVLGDGPILVRLRCEAESKIHEIPLPVGLNPRFPRPQNMVWEPP